MKKHPYNTEKYRQELTEFLKGSSISEEDVQILERKYSPDRVIAILRLTLHFQRGSEGAPHKKPHIKSVN